LGHHTRIRRKKKIKSPPRTKTQKCQRIQGQRKLPDWHTLLTPPRKKGFFQNKAQKEENEGVKDERQPGAPGARGGDRGDSMTMTVTI